jgi:hypothetical protein
MCRPARTFAGSSYKLIRCIKAQEEFFARVRKIEPRFMAVFGAETESIFLAVYSGEPLGVVVKGFGHQTIQP